MILYSVLIARAQVLHRSNHYISLFSDCRSYNSMVRKLRNCIFSNSENNNANCIGNLSMQNIFNYELCGNISCDRLTPGLTG